MTRLRPLVFAGMALLAVWLQDNILRPAWGWSPELLFGLLVTAALFLDLWEFTPLALLAVWLLAWPLELGLDAPVFLLLLLASFFAARFLPMRPVLIVFLLSLSGVLLLTLALRPGLFLSHVRLILSDAVLTAVFGTLLFGFCRALGYRVRSLGPAPQRLPIYLP